MGGQSKVGWPAGLPPHKWFSHLPVVIIIQLNINSHIRNYIYYLIDINY